MHRRSWPISISFVVVALALARPAAAAPSVVVTLSPSSQSLTSGSMGSIKATLNQVQPVDITLVLTSSDPSVVEVPSPAEFTISAGKLDATRTVVALSGGTVTLNVHFEGSSGGPTAQVWVAAPADLAMTPEP